MTGDVRCAIDVGTGIVHPVTELLHRLTAITTAKRILYIVGAPDGDIRGRDSGRVATAIDTGDAGLTTTVDDHPCLLTFIGQVVSLVATAVDGLNLIIFMCTASVFRSSAIHLNEHIAHRTAIEIITTEHTSFHWNGTERRTTRSYYILRIL